MMNLKRSSCYEGRITVQTKVVVIINIFTSHGDLQTSNQQDALAVLLDIEKRNHLNV